MEKAERGIKQEREEFAIVLDFLPNGYPFSDSGSYRKRPVVQAIGTKGLTLLELAPKVGIFLQPQQKIYIGELKRDEIHHIIARLSYSKLTNVAKGELSYALDRIIDENEKKFVDFFNNAAPLTTRMHSLELLPGMGKKRMWELLEEKEKKPFESLNEINERVRLIPNAKEMVKRRILKELEGNEKHYIFVRP
ncbi:MAG: putative nucleotide binding protein [Candidatus Woesearchaeota archaeon]|nr:putative nucleotide binding protein [Candidatus Woesearchaeota archaeon]